MKYKIIKNISSEALERLIEDRLSNGWKLAGGVSVCRDGSSILYAQAIYYP